MFHLVNSPAHMLSLSYDQTTEAPEHLAWAQTGTVVWCILLQYSERAAHAKGRQPMQPACTPAAHVLWDAIPSHFQERMLHNVWCPQERTPCHT